MSYSRRCVPSRTNRSSSAPRPKTCCVFGSWQRCVNLDTPRLSVQEQAELDRSHLDWYRQLAEKACEEWFGEHQLDWLHRLRREMPNLQEALQVALTVAPADAVEMATNLRDPWTAIGMLQQGRRWIEKALDAAPAEPNAARLQAIVAAAELAFLQVDMPTMAARQAEARELLTTVTDHNSLAYFNANEGALALLRGELDLARSLAEQSLASADEFRVQILCPHSDDMDVGRRQ